MFSMTSRLAFPFMGRRDLCPARCLCRSFYSFNMGPVHFLMLDSEIPSDPSSEQGRRVEGSLGHLCRHAARQPPPGQA